jgi:hypothetical protein
VNASKTTCGEQTERFLEVNALTNAANYLESAAQFLQRDDDFKWKWVAIAIFHALYGFSIVALEDGYPERISVPLGRKDDQDVFVKRLGSKVWSRPTKMYLTRNKAAYRIKWEMRSEEPAQSSTPDTDVQFIFAKRKLIGVWTALARIQDGVWMERLFNSHRVTINDEDLKAIEWLGLKVRNELVHFVPKLQGISVEGIWCGCLAALTVIESLVFESNTIWLIDEDGRDRTKKVIARLRDGLAAHTRIS